MLFDDVQLSHYMVYYNPILGYSLKFIFFQNKNQKYKIKAVNIEKAGRGIQLYFWRKIKA
jgi:hypothetical protein